MVTRGRPEDREAAAAPLERVPGVSPDFIRLLITGRWIAIVAVLLTLRLHLRFPADDSAVAAVVVMAAAYNTGQWLLLRAGRLRRYPPAILVGVDLALVTLLVWHSGGVRSPFVNLYYLVVIVAAAFGDLRGSLLAATAAAGLQLLVVFTREPLTPQLLRLQYLVSTLPYLVLVALVAGHLVRQLRGEWERRRQAERELDALNRELEIARQVQSSLTGRPVPRVPGLALAAHTEPLYGIGGDIQDYAPTPEGVGITIADISGHSLPAALVAVRLSEFIERADPRTALEQVARAGNQAVYDATPPEVFVAAIFCQVRRHDGRVRYAVAGNPPPLIYRCRAGRAALLDGCRGPLLGVLEEACYPVCEEHLEIGDVLLLYTDGAIDARGADGEILGAEGLAAILARRAGLPIQEMVDRLAGDIRSGREVRDDLTLVAIARAEEGAGP
ncbi:MAG: serine/threonine-protein phosphatase [Armatimonadetes bacterium]|nr:serine/threonine-protein phosphatase [Armatimonadota bacterium]